MQLSQGGLRRPSRPATYAVLIDYIELGTAAAQVFFFKRKGPDWLILLAARSVIEVSCPVPENR
jgi:hypothetical protein